MPNPFLSSEEYDERAHALYNEGQYDEALDVQLHRVRIEREPLTEHVERLVVLSLVVEGVRALVVLLGAQEGVRHISGILRLT